MTSLPFYAILLAHMGQNYGYETLMTELPTYMKQVLRFSIKEVISCKQKNLSNYNFINCSVDLEWTFVSSAVPCYVAVFNVHFGCRRLDDLLESFHTHCHSQDHQQYW